MQTAYAFMSSSKLGFGNNDAHFFQKSCACANTLKLALWTKEKYEKKKKKENALFFTESNFHLS